MTVTFKIDKNDVIISSATGRPIEIEGKEKFTQDVRETLETDVQANGTGAGLKSVIRLLGDVFSLRAEISRRISDAFDAYKAIQDATQKFDRTAEERFGKVAQLIVLPLRDPSTGSFSNTDYAWRADILSVKGSDPSSITGFIRR